MRQPFASLPKIRFYSCHYVLSAVFLLDHPLLQMQGMRVFERLNKVILASWESILSRTRAKALSMVEAAIFGQNFAILEAPRLGAG
jgi:hypothetical protein